MTAMLIKPRDYQLEAIKALHTEWDAGIWRPAVVLPTGAGKGVVFALLAEEYLKANPHKRVIVLSHTDELVLKAVKDMHAAAPHRSIGIVKAERREVHAQLISASVQSLRSKARRDAIKNVGLIIVDECHHAVAATYRMILDHYGAFNAESPGCIVAGFTATLIRGDKGKLSDVWQKVAYSKDIAFMIRRGYLLNVRGKRIVVPEFDPRNVKMIGGDYQESALGEALSASLAPQIVAEAVVEHAAGRKGILFAPTVDSAYEFAAALIEQGISTAVVHGGLKRDERRQILADFKSGKVQWVCNCMVLTEGFDEPTADVCVICRITTNSGLYQQMVGRVLRPDLTVPPADRQPALLMDVTGTVSRRHGLQSLIDLTTRRDLDDREDLDEDLTLLELEDLVEPGDLPVADGNAPPEEYYLGPVEVEDFDPLGRDSKRTWKVTPDGWYYIRAGVSGGYVFLVPSLEGDPGTFDVIWCTKIYQGAGSAGMTEYKGLSFEMAISWAEEEALERGGTGTKTLTNKSSPWRRKPASSGAIFKARKASGITFEKDADGRALNEDGALLTAGEVSDVIDAADAAHRIDPLVKAVLGKVSA